MSIRHFVQDATLRHQPEQASEHDFVLGDHDVAQSGFGGMALDLERARIAQASRLTDRDHPMPALSLNSWLATLAVSCQLF